MIRFVRSEVERAARFARSQERWIGDAVSEAVRNEEDVISFDVDLAQQAHREMRAVCRMVEDLARRVEELEGLR